MDDHYFTADPTSAFRRAPATFVAWGHEMTVETGSGVFAQGRLDIGTAALLHGVEPPAPGRILDLGCGSGALLPTLLSEPGLAEVVGVYVSHRALQEAARRLRLDRMPERRRDRLQLLQGALTYTDRRLVGYDAAVLMEVVEHLDPDRLPALEIVGGCCGTDARHVAALWGVG